MMAIYKNKIGCCSLPAANVFHRTVAYTESIQPSSLLLHIISKSGAGPTMVGTTFIRTFAFFFYRCLWLSFFFIWAKSRHWTFSLNRKLLYDLLWVCPTAFHWYYHTAGAMREDWKPLHSRLKHTQNHLTALSISENILLSFAYISIG